MADLANIIYCLQVRDRSKDKMYSDKQKHEEVSVIDMVLKIASLLLDSHSIVPSCAYQYLLKLKQRLKLRSIEQASLLVMLMNNSDDQRIRLSDLAKQYGVPTLTIIDKISELDDLVIKEVIARRRDSSGCSYYRITENTIREIRLGRLPAPRDVTGLTTVEFYDEVDSLLNLYKDDELDDEQLEDAISKLMEGNKRLMPVQYLKHQHLEYEDLLLVLVMADSCLTNNDDEFSRYDFTEFFEHREVTYMCNLLESGNHELIKRGLVEQSCVDGKVDSTSWKLTEKAKTNLLSEVKVVSSNFSHLLSHYQEVVYKRLYFNQRITTELNLLRSILKHRRFVQIQKELEKNGMRKGFACLFYGAPGTGKTEAVLQLSRESKRDIMMVDVPTVRSKWVGETEKNIKEIFDRYHALVKGCKQAPILLFNEADAIFGIRKEEASNSVEKMENALQNIILQELEQLDGILIATTNLSCNLDPAFERRFLYKIEFDRPSPLERQHIWRTMLPDLSKAQAAELANSFDFSGGQIENIARKRIVSDIITNSKTLDMTAIRENCKAETMNNIKNRKAIGFTA